MEHCDLGTLILLINPDEQNKAKTQPIKQHLHSYKRELLASCGLQIDLSVCLQLDKRVGMERVFFSSSLSEWPCQMLVCDVDC